MNRAEMSALLESVIARFEEDYHATEGMDIDADVEKLQVWSALVTTCRRLKSVALSDGDPEQNVLELFSFFEDLMGEGNMEGKFADSAWRIQALKMLRGGQ